jgi:hypothetical protein
MKTRVLHVDLAAAERCVLHLRRKRMRDGITENAEANGRINITRDLTPFFKVSNCVAVGRLRSIHVIPNEVRDLS